ncbi:leucine-rich melanocyte differentiation-associated protein-like isoform X3 [Nylanderia fulva]|uniref:leucine-rich melanocyte differentiation-associated protein-like isoform X1 n=2 Tax=Nylanderia fulva TaxID=613905 RepID=UPI0010FB4506|nr:leucine-rich melanocyte differentiation-associated protein-like isoform X1 [Nylanderia fulva]XP_029154961.1 leucine-rich melanocyte differentiation-associated protein-like isoform X2 [Nylanderia fulva]XP_029154962.1 leucine-rich melanocyte differentiation-associated protein-like isoform X3 [Nylanderia fulva]
MSNTSNEVKYTLKAKEKEEYAMTCLGTYVFMDKHCRQLSTSDSSSAQQIDSLSLAYEDLFTMPYNIKQDYDFVKHLDISHNVFSRNLQFLSEFDNLRSLNLDHNKIDENTVFPFMPNLELLWLNNNLIKNLYPFIKNLYKSIPNLKYLCLMGNEAAPSYLNGGSFFEYLQYRLFVLSWFPHLVHLDDRIVTDEQLLEAKRMFKRPLLENVIELPECIKDLHNKINIFSKSSMSDGQKISRGTNLII